MVNNLRQKTIEKIFNRIGVDENLLTDLEKFVSLEEDKETVKSVEFDLPDYDLSSAEEINFSKQQPFIKVDIKINKSKWFKNKEELTNYLKKYSFSNIDIDEFEEEVAGAAHAEINNYAVFFYKQNSK